MNIRYATRAFADREAIFSYIEEKSAQGARTVKRAIKNAIQMIASHPRIGRLTDESDVYELVVPRQHYKIYYKIDTENILIIHIRHTSREEW